jgi:tetratricopeptide (TPR) repeat protein
MPLSSDNPEARAAEGVFWADAGNILISKSLADDSAATDSVRMAAAVVVGDAAFIKHDFKTATAYYKKAMQFEGDGGHYRFRAGVGALAAGDTADAIACFIAVVGTNDAKLSNRARVKLGDIAIARGEYASAMKWFQETGPFSSKNGWSVPSFIGKLTCAKYLGLADSAAVFERLLSLYAKTMLEKERFKKAQDLPLLKKGMIAAKVDQAPSRPRPAAAKTSKTPAGKGDSSYTLQVGAFSSRERAMELRQKLLKNHKDVACVPALVSEQTFYRVWVGDFASREEADRFGKNRFQRQGQAYRIVMRQ